MELPPIQNPLQNPPSHSRAKYGIHYLQAIASLPGKYKSGARTALKMAATGLERNFRHGCTLLNGSRIIATGRNYDYKTHPRGSGPFTTLHAEINTLANLDYEAEPITVIICRLNTNGYIRSSFPCPNCLDQLRLRGIETVVYTEDEGWKVHKL